jgi:predicted amidohydrolase
MTTMRVALVQLDADTDVAANIERATDLADRAAATGAELVALPEYLQYRGDDAGFRASARPIPGPHTEPFAEIARSRGCWVLAGSTAETAPDPERPYNTSVLLDPEGELVARYRKIHLFDVAVDAGPVDTESARVTAGEALVMAPLGDDGAVLGMTVCYDLRFPELYRSLALRGATIMSVPSAFTERTGRDHWEVLLRARAIENGAWVVAPAQVGGVRIPAYGHAMVVDPWGTVVAQASDGVGIVSAEIDLDRVTAVRRQIPALANRRPDAYGI